MGEVIALNGGQPAPQAYQCGIEACQNQNWRLLLEGEIECGSCGTPSAFMHYAPLEKRVGRFGEAMRLKKSIADHVDNYLCPRCSNNHFHLHASGRITCFRCRHSVPNKHWNPAEA